MKSSKLAFIGCCVAGILIVSNIFMLRYFTETIKNGLKSDGKSRIISQFSFQASPGPINDEYGILADDPILDAKTESPGETSSNKNSEGDLEKELPRIEAPVVTTEKKHESFKDFLARPNMKTTTTTEKPTTPKEHPDLEKLINEISSPATGKCQLKVKFGRDEDKGFGHETWRLCFDEPYKIKSQDCIAYSFGVAYDFTFDDDIANFGCKVFSFDPSMVMPDHKRKSGVMFFNIGIAQHDSFTYKPEINAYNNKTSWVVKSLRTIRRDLKHTDVTLDVVKMDVEGMEWVSVEQAIEDGIMEKTRFFLVEWHVCPKDFKTTSKVAKARRVYSKLADLGFVKYFSDPWITDPLSNCRMVLNYFVRPESFAS